jgi:Domain of unknown function (DUF4145)
MATYSTKYEWHNVQPVGNVAYECGYCSHRVGPSLQFYARALRANQSKNTPIFICPTCSHPTFFDFDGKQVPAVRMGAHVPGITDPEVQRAYDEARDCTAAGAYTASVLICRKILMNLAVQHGAKPGLNFTEYVTYLEQARYVPPNGLAWVDKIRQKGNEATHELPQITQPDAAQIMRFVEMLLRFSYEFKDEPKGP